MVLELEANPGVLAPRAKQSGTSGPCSAGSVPLSVPRTSHQTRGHILSSQLPRGRSRTHPGSRPQDTFENDSNLCTCEKLCTIILYLHCLSNTEAFSFQKGKSVRLQNSNTTYTMIKCLVFMPSRSVLERSHLWGKKIVFLMASICTGSSSGPTVKPLLPWHHCPFS